MKVTKAEHFLKCYHGAHGHTMSPTAPAGGPGRGMPYSW